MCGSYGFSVDRAVEVYARFQIENEGLQNYQPRWNIKPGQVNPVVVRHSPNSIQYMFWGLIPSFADDKDYAYKYKTINARSETVHQLRTFKEPFRTKRCVIPATFFYEPDKSQKPSIPYLFRLKNKEMFGMAGLYDTWTDSKTGTELVSYTIITVPANNVVGKVHHRMPAILTPEEEEEWLNHDTIEPEHLLPLLHPFPDDLMEGYRVSRSVWSYKVDSPELMEPDNTPTQESLLPEDKQGSK